MSGIKSQLSVLVMPRSAVMEGTRADKEVRDRAQPFKAGFRYMSGAVVEDDTVKPARSGTKCLPGGSVPRRGKKRFG